MATTLSVFAKISPKPEYFDDARNAVLGAISETLSEDGCLQFVLHEGLKDKCLYLYEEWKSEEALALHYEMPFIKKIFEQYEAWLSEPVEVTKMHKVV